MDIEVVIKKTLVFTGLLVSVFIMLIVPTLLIQEYLVRNAGMGARIVGLTISGIIIILTMRRIETLLVNITDKYLFQKKYDYKELLKTFTEEVLTVLDLDKLVKITVDKLTDIIKLSSCELILSAKDPARVLKYMPNTRAEYTLQNNELAIPMIHNNKTIGVLLLGKKMSDEDYGKDDLDILLPLARSLAIAISNAELFREVGKAQAEVAQREKMATIGTLAAGMAHEIRNPITTIRTFADHLPDKYSDKSFITIFKRLIPVEIGKVDDITRSLLEFSSGPNKPSGMEELDIAEQIEKVLALLTPQYKFSEVKVIVDTDHEGRTVINKRQIQDIFFNILRYIFLETPRGSNIIINIIRKDSMTDVLIKDDKLKISDVVLKDVFEPGSKLYKERRGFGFNLFIAKELLERNGGGLKISSNDGEGTRFVLSFK